MPAHNEGGISAKVIIMMFFILIVVGGLSLQLSTQILAVRKISDRTAEETECRNIAREIIDYLAEDSTPESDSLNELQNLNEKIQSLYEDVSVKTCSDNINPYFVRKNIFEKTDLNKLMANGHNIDQWQQWREDNFLAVTDGEWLKEFFVEDAFKEKFSFIGYINFNNTDEFVLRQVYGDAIGETGKTSFHSRIQGLLLSGKILNREEFKQFLGLDFEKLYPMMNTESSWNVHFLDADTLLELLKYPAYEIADPSGKKALFVADRKSGEIPPQKLITLISKPKEAPIFTYLGTKSWFYSVEIRRKTINYRIIVMQLPPESDTMTEEKYRIVEEKTFRETSE